MVDLTEFNGEEALRASLQKKRDAAQAKLEAAIAKAQLKIVPLQGAVEKLDALLQVLEGGNIKTDADPEATDKNSHTPYEE